MQFQTLIHARIPRAQCEAHGVRNVKFLGANRIPGLRCCL
ncbi:hypothetical protein LEP1GSC193_3089 [Leptospira alstonii serovar Pingchang str. 80-412]|uniref:Uncharacterized protein n=1 Tax=Leptospira alstonii serovar Pingchang str. 80-412 TaxID=1218564 RepID=T0H583_9LEPT|nr:hypothetical protein LEP1GSC193_3089 [Leptospira alstonii serovar Pingchang str. 80-412]